MHTILIALHAVTAVAALVAAVVGWRRIWAIPVHESLVAVCILALAGVVVIDWPTLDPVTRIVFAAFCGLGVAMVAVAHRARQVDGTRRRWALGFNIIALTDGFVVIAVLDAGNATALVVAAGVAVAVLGHLVLRRVAPDGRLPVSARV